MNLHREIGSERVADAIGARLARDYSGVPSEPLPERMRRAVEALDERMGDAADFGSGPAKKGRANPQ